MKIAGIVGEVFEQAGITLVAPNPEETYQDRFVKLVPSERVVEVVEFETDPGCAAR